jgi:hypothetical protein
MERLKREGVKRLAIVKSPNHYYTKISIREETIPL